MFLYYIVPNFYRMYIRVKKVKKKSGKVYEYGHLVLSKWRKRAKIRGGSKKPVQKYQKLIGRVYRYSPSYFTEFEDFVGGDYKEFVEKSNVKEVYGKFLEYELISCGFKKIGKVLAHNGLFVDLERLIVYNHKGEAIIKVGEKSNYLCSLNLEELFKFEYLTGKQDGMQLLKKLRMAGIKIEPENFFILAKKMLDIGNGKIKF